MARARNISKYLAVTAIVLALIVTTMPAAFASGDVADVIEDTWKEARNQIKKIVNNVVFPVIDLLLAVFFFIKIATAYFDYRKTGQFEWIGPVVLFACLVFTLTAPLYLWEII